MGQCPPTRPAARSIAAYTKGTNALLGGRERCQCPPHYAATDNRHYVPEGGAFSVHYFRYSDAGPQPKLEWANGDVYGFYGRVGSEGFCDVDCRGKGHAGLLCMLAGERA